MKWATIYFLVLQSLEVFLSRAFPPRQLSVSTSSCCFVLLLSFICLSGCASSQSKALFLHKENYLEISHSPPVYVLSTSQGEKVWITGVQQCGGPEKVPEEALVRQLLVGFTELEREETQHITFDNNRLLYSRWKVADQEKTPLLLEIYTQRKKECITDVVFWMVRQSESPRLLLSFEQKEETLRAFFSGEVG